VKLLLDQNLSFRILPKIMDLYPHSAHVKDPPSTGGMTRRSGVLPKNINS